MAHVHFTTTGIVKTVLACGVVGGLYMQPFRPMVVVGHSMEPSYRNMTVCLTEPVPKSGLKVGDVVVIDMPEGPIVKRIAFMPGDVFLQTMINNEWVDIVDVNREKFEKEHPDRFREIVVPPEMMYVLGDNKVVSMDSREFGCIPISSVESKLVDQRPSGRW